MLCRKETVLEGSCSLCPLKLAVEQQPSPLKLKSKLGISFAEKREEVAKVRLLICTLLQ
jgi:hypothetical protein